MLFAVCRYRVNGNSLKSQDRIAVLDTIDGTVELIPWQDIKELPEGTVINIQWRNGRPYRLVNSRICTGLSGSTDGVIQVEYGKIIFFGTEIYYHDGKRSLEVNNTTIVQSETNILWYLMYMFKYRDYIVMRLRSLNSKGTIPLYSWYTVVINKSGAVCDSWGSSPVSSLGIMIDTVLEV